MAKLTPRTLGVLLLISLAFNLLIVGTVIGRWSAAGWHGPFGIERSWMGGRPHHEGKHGRMGPKWLSRALDDEAAARVRPIWEKHEDAIRASGKSVREARKAAHKVMKTEPFDKTAYSDALQELGDRRVTLQSAIHAAMVETISALDPEDRKALAEHRHRKRWFGEHRKLD